MNIIVVFIGSVENYPPVINLVQTLNEIDINVTLITNYLKKETARVFPQRVTIETLNEDYAQKHCLLYKFYRIFKIRKKIWPKIERYYNSDSLIWVVTDTTLIHLGKKILKKKYNFQMMELAEKVYYYSRYKLFKINIKKYSQRAKKVIVCEYNRAHITKAWWELNDVPVILPNKPYNTLVLEKNNRIEHSKEASVLIKKLKDKKIILYQGTLGPERPLLEYIKAVQLLGDEYVFIIMSEAANEYEQYVGNNFYYIPFIAPPYHLEITSHAYIGVLSYVPTEGTGYSTLNSLYCAPNKLFEYSMFGIPMISNDNPALKTLFQEYKMGIASTRFTAEEIAGNILEIKKNYEEKSENAKKYFDSVNIEEIVKSCLD